MIKSSKYIILQIWAILISLCLSGFAAGNFQEGEFVPTARRAQFHGVRYCQSVSVAAMYVA